MKEKLRIAAMVLLVIALLAIMGGFWTFVSWQAGQEKQQEMAEGQSGQQEEGGLEAMYISLGASGEAYVLADASGVIECELPEEELYDEYGGRITCQDLFTGDKLILYGNIIATRSLPPQYKGITKAVLSHRGTPEDALEYAEEIQTYFGLPIDGTERSSRSLAEDAKQNGES